MTDVVSPTETIEVPKTVEPTRAPPVRRVLLISADGLRPDAIQQVDTPNIDALIARGAVSWTAKTVLPSVTLPAHASMLSGQTVGQHGVTWNDALEQQIYIQGTTLHQLVHEAGGRSVLLVTKPKLLHLARPDTYAELVIFLEGLDSETAARAAELIAQGFDFMFVHLLGNDFFGHRSGWMSEAYLQNVQDTDLAVGRMVEALEGSGLLDETVIILSADHGGHDRSHGSGLPEDMTIPWIIAGPGVKSGTVLSSPVSTMDTAPTAAFLLGLPIPGEWSGKVVREALKLSDAGCLGDARCLGKLQNGGWFLGPSTQPIATSEMPAALLDGLIYVAGGFGDLTGFNAYDPRADTWTGLAPLPEGRHHGMLAAYQRRLYFFGGATEGGFDARMEAWRYAPAADVWERIADLPEPRLGGAAVALDNQIFIVGGAGDGLDLLGYFPAQGGWQRLAPLSTLRDHCAAVALDGKLYALGGRNGADGELASAEIYDPAANAWTPGVPMLSPRSGFGAATFRGQIAAAGGELVFSRQFTLGSIEFFNPQTNVWTLGPDLPFPVHGVPLVAAGNALYLIGGSDQAGAIENSGRVMEYGP